MNKMQLINITDSLFIQSGYVLDFTNPSFEQFIYNSISINIYSDDNYLIHESKGNKLRRIINTEDWNIVLKLFGDLVDYYEDYILKNEITLDKYKKKKLLELKIEIEKSVNFFSVPMVEIIEKKFIMISTRSAKFSEMSTNEKLKEINNLMENMLKQNNKFISIDLEKSTLGYIKNNSIKVFREETQCFRHSSDNSLNEREKYSDIQKSFLIDYGITLLNLIHRTVYNKNI